MRRTERIQRVHDRLRRQRFEVLARYRDELARAAKHAAWRESEDVERAADQWDIRVLELLSEHDRHLLIGISQALDRIAQGTYESCALCSGWIDEAAR